MKKKMCFLMFVATGAITFLLVYGNFNAQALECTPGKPCNLVFSTFYKEDFTAVKVANWLMDEITKRSKGGVVFKKYYSGSLIGSLDTMSGCGKGMADLVIDSPLYSPDRVPMFIIETVCFLTDDPWVHGKALNELVATEDILKKEWKDQNVHYFYSNSVTPCQLALRKKIAKMEELKGLKIRAIGPQAAAFQAMGAIPVGIPFPEIYDALSKRTIDGVDTFPFDIGVIYKLHEVAPYWVKNPIGCFGVQTLLMNANTYNGLPSDIRKLFDEVAEEASDRYIEEAMTNDKKYMDIFIKDKGKIVELTPEESQKWINVGKEPAAKWWLDMVAKKGLDGKPTLKHLQDLIEKWKKTGKSKYSSVFEYSRMKYGQ